MAKVEHRCMNEEELWAAYRGTPDDLTVVRALIGALRARDAEIPLDLEERSIVLQRRGLPDDTGLVRAHVAVLVKQGKPVSPELEELSLTQILAADPDNNKAVRALVALYLRTGDAVPPDLEKRSLALALEERPGDPELLRALAAVEAKSGSPQVSEAPGPATPASINVRSTPTDEIAPPLPGQPAANRLGLEGALKNALSARPADTYLLAELINVLIDAGRIKPQTDIRTVMSLLPPQVQTSEAVVVALLGVASRNMRTVDAILAAINRVRPPPESTP
jgi:hypothetical protein